MRSTINAQLQRDTEAALQEGLAEYEMASGRVQFRGPEANIADAVKKIGPTVRRGMPAWQQALQAVRLPLYDVHWTPAVIVQKGDGKKDDGAIRVGLPDGRIMPLTGLSYVSRRGLGLYDVVYVNVVESRRSEVRAPAVDARGNPVRPKPQVDRFAAARRNCACGRRCRARRWCWRTRPAASSPWPAAFPIR